MKCLRRNARGFTLVEMAISLSLGVLVVGSMGLVARQARNAYTARTLTTDLEARTRRAVDKLTSEMLMSGESVLTPDPAVGVGGDDVTYLKVDGLVGGVIDWSDPCRFHLEYEPGEIDDGLDNNGNGLVDEGRVIWTRDVGLGSESSRVLCTGVSEFSLGELDNGLDDNGDGLADERGLSFQRDGRSLQIRLTLERVDEDGRLQQRMVETTVRLRNG